MSDTAPATLALPDELTIYTVGSLRQNWLAWLNTLRDDAVIDGSAVSQVDAAGVQLLAALQRAIESSQLNWRLLDPTEALQQAFLNLGLAHSMAAGSLANPAA